jgi:hypothetical protein
MTRDEFQQMLDQHGIVFVGDAAWRVAQLVAAAEREVMKIEGWRQCAKGQRTTQYCGQLEAAVAAEREACARVCDRKVDAEYETGKVDHNEIAWTKLCAIAIRARGQA